MSEEEALAGGTLTAVVRIGDTVRRPMNSWSPTTLCAVVMVCGLGVYQVRPADLSETRPAMALMVSGSKSRRPVKRCRTRHHFSSAMVCSTAIRCEDWCLRSCSHEVCCSDGAPGRSFNG